MANVAEPPPSTNTAEGGDSSSHLSWERSWPLDEVRQNSAEWTLAGDSGLLNFLQAFSQKLISQTHGIEKELTQLVHETKGTNSRLNNAVNDFLNLSNTQFVENRVYEEDIENDNQDDKKSEAPEKTKQEKEAELVPKISSALTYGLAVIESDFIKLELEPNDSDSDDDDDGAIDTANWLEPKDPYINRNLPVLIGSAAFTSDDFVGLKDEASDEEETEEPDDDDEDSDKKAESEFSDSDSSYTSISDDEEIVSKSKIKDEDDDSEAESWSDTDGSDMFERGRKKSNISLSSASSFDDDSNEEAKPPQRVKSQSIGNDDEEEHDDAPGPVPAPKLDFNAELSKKLGLAPAPPPQSNHDDVDNTETKKHKKHRSSSVRSDVSKTKKRSPSKHKPSESKRRSSTQRSSGDEHMFDNSSKTRKSKSKHKSSIASKSRASTMDKNQDGDMFAPDVEDDEFSPFSKKEGLFSGGGSLFDNSDDEGLFASQEPKSKPSENQPKAESKKKRSPSKMSVHKTTKSDTLFEDDEEDDLFSSNSRTASKSKSEVGPSSRKSTVKSDIFGDDEEEDEILPSASTKAPPGKQLPPGAVSMFSGGLGNSLQAALKSRRADSESLGQESDDWGDEDTKPSVPAAASTEPKSIPSSISSKDTKTVKKPVTNDDLFNSNTKSKAPAKAAGGPSLFSDDDDDGLFSSKPASNKPVSKAPEKPKAAPSSGLFENDDDDDLFKVADKPKDSGKKKPTGGISLFGDDLFGEQNEKPTPKQVPKESDATDSAPKKPRTATTLSLFDDDDDDEDDNLFASVNKKSAEPPAKETRSKSFFDDDDDLSHDSKKDSPGVDLFANKKRDRPPSILNEGFKSSTEETKSVAMQSAEDDANKIETTADAKVPKKPAGAVSMFGGINPFAAAKLKSPQKVAAAETPSPVKQDHSDDDVDASKPVSPVKINPAALLPGAKPPMKEHQEASIDLEDPPQPKVLHNFNKDRVKGGVKRRPPSRKSRQTSRMSAADITAPEPVVTAEVTTKSEPTSPMKSETSTYSPMFAPPKFDEIDSNICSSNVPDDIFSPDTEEEDIFPVTGSRLDTNNQNEFSGSKIFSSSNKIDDDEDDIFSDNINSQKSISTNDKPKKIVVEDDDDDMFNPSVTTQPTKSVFKDDGDDDIFNVPSDNKKIAKADSDTFSSVPEKSPAAAKTKSSLFSDDDGDDIFSGISSTPSKTTKAKTNSNSLFGNDDEDDDIFASASSSKSKSNVKTSNSSIKKASTKKPLKTQDDDLFDDPLMSGLK